MHDERATLPGQFDLDSASAGWKSLQLRRYTEPAVADPFDVGSIGHQVLVLIKHAAPTDGKSNVESRRGMRWVGFRYREGDIGMMAPGQQSRLRWHNRSSHVTVQVRLPRHFLEGAAQELKTRPPLDWLNRLCIHDATVRALLLSLEDAASRGVGEPYAESAAHFLSMHLVQTQLGTLQRVGRVHGTLLQRIDDFLHENIDQDFALAHLSADLGMSSFQIIRLCKASWGETPIRRLRRLRIERARELLERSNKSVMQIALECGYSNPAHFATAFRRELGASPLQYRAL
jgi:AraC family transcriptional regulator